MSTNWMRVCKLVVGAGGTGLDLSELRISFEIIKTIEAAPNTATIKVYNLTREHNDTINEVYKDIFLTAGYQDNSAQIFAGNIQFVSHYREQTDYITEITAGDGDRDYRLAYVNETLAAGSTDQQAVDICCAAMNKTQKGTVQLKGGAYLRAKPLCGHARDILTQIARTNGCNWSIQDGTLQMVHSNSMLSGEAIVISAETGLLEAAERNDKGIAAKCMLNPQIVINGAVHLDNSAIILKQKKTKTLGKQKQNAAPVQTNKDGIYKVIKLTHRGDNRDNEWCTEVECIGLGQPVPASRSAIQSGAVPVTGFAPEDMVPQ
jgi:Baseplate hub gp41